MIVNIRRCRCGKQPILIKHYKKGVANKINYFVKCQKCRARTRDRHISQDAVSEWNTCFGELYERR